MKYLFGIAGSMRLLLAAFLLIISKSSKEYQGTIQWKDGATENVSIRLEYKNFDKLFNKLNGTLDLHLDSGWDYKYIANSEFFQLPQGDSQTWEQYEIIFWGPLENSRSQDASNPIEGKGGGNFCTAYFEDPGKMDNLALVSKEYEIRSVPADKAFQEKVDSVIFTNA